MNHVRLRDVGRVPLDDGWLPGEIPPGPEIFRGSVIGPAVVAVVVAAVVFGVGRAYATCELSLDGCRNGENSSPDDRFFHSGNMRLNCAGILLSIGLSVKCRCLNINMFNYCINRLTGHFSVHLRKSPFDKKAIFPVSHAHFRALLLCRCQNTSKTVALSN